jgi:NAD(P)-dependent dehydrogenase (short-subunit alcohol dehydrogenase family)
MKKIVCITGANRGLGLALTKRFLQSDYTVVAGSRKPSDELKKLSAEFPGKLIDLNIDIGQLASVKEAAKTLGSKIEHLDYLINNAAIYSHAHEGKIDELILDDGHLEDMMNINAFGPMRVTQQFLPFLRKGDTKRIVNISSEAGSIGDCWREGTYAYCMSKATLNMETRILDLHLRKEGFTILAIHPGWVRTDMGGSDADISAEESAAGIFEQATRSRSGEDPFFIDYSGKTMAW